MRDDPAPLLQTSDLSIYPKTGRFLLGRGRGRMTPEELVILEDCCTLKDFPARHHLVRRGEPVDTSMMLVRGYVTRYMDDREGYRQLVSVHVPGDFVDLHGFPTGRLDHDVATLGPVTMAMVDHQKLIRITEHHPHLTRILWFSTLLDAAMHREWIFRLGRLGAEGRVAHFFCELLARLEMVGLTDGNRFELPLTQPDLAEACGLTGVHVNRVLRVLRERGLMTFKNGQVEIMDRSALDAVAEFQSDYLYADMGQWHTN